ncbi:hypothetical protein HEP_00159600 [Hepatocystis sp. ex Piliocolobus tephrosceles]|nr:hypothetical protein HEP_00159600 [Hepatocystis sp. ex Piliocolobus tephrosceles]
MGCKQSKISDPRKIPSEKDLPKKNTDVPVNDVNNHAEPSETIVKRELEVKPPPVKAIPRVHPKAYNKKVDV